MGAGDCKLFFWLSRPWATILLQEPKLDHLQRIASGLWLLFDFDYFGVFDLGVIDGIIHLRDDLVNLVLCLSVKVQFDGDIGCSH
jgi:hypothetical protein